MRGYHQVNIAFPQPSFFIKGLIITNLGLWFFFVLVLQNFFLPPGMVFSYLGLVPNAVLNNYYFWQPLTYMFMHSPGILHIFVNMLMLWWLGADIERLFGQKMFALYYFTCGVGAAAIYLLVLSLNQFLGISAEVWDIPVVGASGCIFGLFLAYGWFFGQRIVFFMMIFPMRARTMVIFLAAFELLSVLNSGFNSPVANLAHLGGLISGFIFISLWQRTSFSHPRRKQRASARHLRLVMDDKNPSQWEDDEKPPSHWH